MALSSATKLNFVKDFGSVGLIRYGSLALYYIGVKLQSIYINVLILYYSPLICTGGEQMEILEFKNENCTIRQPFSKNIC